MRILYTFLRLGLLLAASSCVEDSSSDPCSKKTCVLNSRCVRRNEFAGCECNKGYVAATDGSCQALETDPCMKKICPTQERCFAHGGRAYCLCDAGLARGKSGKCESPCVPNPCKNGGVCTRKGTAVVQSACTCSSTYSGKYCEIKMGNCEKQHGRPCGRNARCRSAPGGGHMCTCMDGFLGDGFTCERSTIEVGMEKYCLQIKSVDATRVLADRDWFKKFVDDLSEDFKSILKSFPGFMRAEIGAEYRTKPDGRVQATLTVTVWVSLTARGGRAGVKNLIEHYVQSSARKSKFSGIPTACGREHVDGCRQKFSRPCGAGASCRRRTSGDFACVCNSGLYGDGFDCKGKRARETRAVCRAWGDPHYHPFDGGARYDFMGVCKYVMSESTGFAMSDRRWFRVVAENEHRDGNTDVSWLKMITIYLSGGSTVITLGKNGVVMINENEAVESDNEMVKIERSGRTVIITTKNNVCISFNGDGMRIKAPQSYENMLAGLCGNYNGNPEDDLRKKDGDMGSSYSGLAKSYRFGDCNDTSAPEFKCPKKEKIKWSGAEYCGMLLSGTSVFSNCHSTVNVQMFFDACVVDMCATGGRASVMESAFTQYVTDCRDQDIDLCDWRKKSGIGKFGCPEHSSYNGCASKCQNTCMNPSASESCKDKAKVENCDCNTGYVREGVKCVRRSECGCTENGFYYRVGQTVQFDEATCVCEGMNSFKCICKQDYKLIGNKCVIIEDPCSSIPCLNGGECIRNGTSYTCFCVDGYSGKNCNTRNDFEVVVLCLEFRSVEVNGNLNNRRWFDNFVKGLSRDLEEIFRQLSGYVRAEFKASAQSLPNGKVQVTLTVKVWIETGGSSSVGVGDLIRHYVQSSGRKVRFSGRPRKCDPRCKGNKIFSDCASKCIDSCDRKYERCTSDCDIDNHCICPPGMIERKAGGNRCISPNKCPRKSQRDTRAVCHAWGDPHYLTFDRGPRYDFMGVCKYVMSESTGVAETSSRWFRVVAENEHRHGDTRVSWLKGVTIYLFGGSTVITIGKNGMVTIDGNEIIESDNEVVQIERSGSGVVVTTKDGVCISFNGDGMRIKVPTSYKTMLEGLCGNYNGDPDDDRMKKDGTIGIDYSAVASSYQFEKCNDKSAPTFKCTIRNEKKWSGSKYCGMIIEATGIFSDCHSVVDARAFFDACVVDMCATRGNMDVMESAFSEYAADCKDRNIGLCDWRKKSGVRKFDCPKHSSYDGCASKCQDTCLNPRGSESCKDNAQVEDCVCDPGYVREGFKCVRRSECGCVEDGFYYRIGQNVEFERATCVCEGLNLFRCTCKPGHNLVGNKCVRGDPFESASSVICVEFTSIAATGNKDDRKWFDRFVKDLTDDLQAIFRQFSGYMRAEFQVSAQGLPNGKVQVTLVVRVWIDLTGRRSAGAEDLIRHYVQSSARKARFSGTPRKCSDIPEINRQVCLLNLRMPCANEAFCTRNGNSYMCRCRSGYFGNGFNCDRGIWTDECHRHFGRSCATHARCDPLNDRQYRCNCVSGYKGDGFDCQSERPDQTDGGRQLPQTGGGGQPPQTGGGGQPPQTGGGGQPPQIHHRPGQPDQVENRPKQPVQIDSHLNQPDQENNHPEQPTQFDIRTRYPCFFQFRQFCHQYATCSMDNNSGQYRCQCWRGFFGDGFHCQYQPADRCQRRSGRPCDRNADCTVDRSGLYQCRCRNGYFGNGHLCRANPGNECERNFGQRCHSNAQCLLGADGSHRCECMKDYAGNGFNCQVQNECTRRYGIPCHQHAGCEEEGDNFYTCQCRGDYVGDGFNCIDRSGCHKQTGNSCHQDAFCLDMGDNGYRCQCRAGYVGNGYSECNELFCQRPSDINQGTISPSQGKYQVGQVISYICQHGHMLVGDPTRRCMPTREWDGAPPMCIKDGEVGQRGQIDRSTLFNAGQPGRYQDQCHWFYDMPCSANGGRCIREQSGDIYRCSCQDGYFGDGFHCQAILDRSRCSTIYGQDCHQNAECQVDALGNRQCYCRRGYRGDGFHCEGRACQRPRDIEFGRVVDTEGIYVINHVITYQCEGGYQIHGNMRRTCLSDGTWSGSSPICKIADNCFTRFAQPCHHEANCISTERGYVCVCKEGYTGDGTNCKVPGCQRPRDIERGRVLSTQGLFTAGNVIAYQCDTGFTVVGDSLRTCQQDGRWTGTEPFCRPGQPGVQGTPVVQSGQPGQPAQPGDCLRYFSSECSDFADCFEIGGGNFLCHCRAGYAGNGFECQGI